MRILSQTKVMTGAVQGISAVVTAPFTDNAVLDLAAVLDGLVGGSHEILLVNPDLDSFSALQHRFPHLPLRVSDPDLAVAVTQTRYELTLLTTGAGDLDVFELNHFLDAIEDGADLALGYRPWTLERLTWSAFGHVLFGKTARDVDCPFKLFRQSVWQRTSMEPHGVDRWFSTRLVVRARRLGFRVVELAVRATQPGLGRATSAPGSPSSEAQCRVA